MKAESRSAKPVQAKEAERVMLAAEAVSGDHGKAIEWLNQTLKDLAVRRRCLLPTHSGQLLHSPRVDPAGAHSSYT